MTLDIIWLNRKSQFSYNMTFVVVSRGLIKNKTNVQVENQFLSKRGLEVYRLVYLRSVDKNSINFANK